jgi:hypothetical protein
MIWRHRGQQLTVEHYHGVPVGWAADILFARHKKLGGWFPLSDFMIGPWSAPSFMSQRHEWLRYRTTLGRVALGIRAGDLACVELAVQYIELRYIGSYSGYLRAKLARALKSAELTAKQKQRLDAHFLNIVTERDYTGEWQSYRALWGRFIDRKTLDAVIAHFATFQDKGRGHKPAELAWLPQLVAAFKQRERGI